MCVHTLTSVLYVSVSNPTIFKAFEEFEERNR